VSNTLFALSWPANLLREAIVASTVAGPVGNTLHFLSGVTASFFLPLGYLGMSLLGMRRAPWLATICAGLSLVGWIPWSALVGIDDLGWRIATEGSTPQLTALWTHFSSDPVMLSYLLIYIIGSLLSTVLISFLLARLHLIPAWAAWAFALTSPLKILLFFPSPILAVRSVLAFLICALWIIGAIPAALAMFKARDLLPQAPSHAQKPAQGAETS
jgi:hypothetical protein